jgi:hypothetical protein
MEETFLKLGLAVNANETVSEIVRKSVEVEKSAIDYLWVSDVPVQLYAPTVASAVAASTKKIRIGLGLLSVFLYTPVQIASSVSTLVEGYGERFELCIGPGDKNLLKSVGIHLYHHTGVPNHILSAKNQIEKILRKRRVKCRIWLGAQGPKMLEISKFFDGVLLNYAQPDAVNWAVNKVGHVRRKDFQFGVFSSSYFYRNFDPKIYNLLRISSAIVALGASETVLKELSLREEVVEARKELEKGKTIASIIDRIPAKAVELFSICKPSTELGKYLSEISKMKIEHIAFGYPQNFSHRTIEELTQALKDYTQVYRSYT